MTGDLWNKTSKAAQEGTCWEEPELRKELEHLASLVSQVETRLQEIVAHKQEQKHGLKGFSTLLELSRWLKVGLKNASYPKWGLSPHKMQPDGKYSYDPNNYSTWAKEAQKRNGDQS